MTNQAFHLEEENDQLLKSWAECRQLLTDERKEAERLRGIMETAKQLIGAQNDNASPAVKESNLNRAWHLLNDVR